VQAIYDTLATSTASVTTRWESMQAFIADLNINMALAHIKRLKYIHLD